MDYSQPKQKDNRKIIYTILIIALLGTWAYIIYDKSKTRGELSQKDSQITDVTSAKDSLQRKLLDASTRIDSLTTGNFQLQGSLAEKNSDILKLKANVASTLKKEKLSAAEVKEANEKIAQLNQMIDGLTAQIQQLKQENAQLTSDNKQLTGEKNQLTSDKQNLQQDLSKTQGEKQVLAEKVDVASTLHASNINVTAVHVKGNGKETETSNAKRADMFVISCLLDENRVTPSGTKALYVCVFNPDGSPSGSNGTFTTREDGDKSYTDKVTVNYEQGKSTPVSFNWKPTGNFASGDYKIEIYNNGFKIGEGRKTLKKGGFLGL
jgi:myosin heavy subunit